LNIIVIEVGQVQPIASIMRAQRYGTKQLLGVQIRVYRTAKQSKGMMIGMYISVALLGSSSALLLHRTKLSFSEFVGSVCKSNANHLQQVPQCCRGIVNGICRSPNSQ
jgi:hypothetical protein